MKEDTYIKLRNRIAYEKAGRGNLTPEQIASAEAVLATYPELRTDSSEDLRAEAIAILQEAPGPDFVARCNDLARRLKETTKQRREEIRRSRPKTEAKPRDAAPKKVLNIKSVEKAEPRETRYEMPDASLPGFYLSVMPSGHKSYCVRYRFQGTPRRLGLGSHPQITPQDARKAARDALGRVAMGDDPAGDKAASRRAPAPSAPLTINDLIEKYLTRYVVKNCRASTAASYKRILEKNVLPASRGRAADSISRADVRALVEEIAEDRPILANRALAILSGMFAWAVEKGLLEASPVIGLKKPAAENKRQRVLSDAELRLVLDAADKLPRIGRHFVHLLTLTMQRRNEIAHAKWSWLDWDARTLTIPADCAKNGREHRLPLSDAAVDILKDRAKDETGSPYVFCRGRYPFNGFARLKEALDKLIAEANGGPIPPWTFHDLRRTGASVMPRLKVSLPVTERILNHVSGSFGGIVSVYQRYDYEPEMRQAMDCWAGHLIAIRADNIIQLRRA